MKKIITIICMVISTMFYGQNVTVSIQNIKVNDVNLPNGQPINLMTNNSVNVKFRVDLAKQQHYIIGDCKLRISVFNSNGNESQHAIINVPESEFITGASANFDIDIYASEINFGTGNYLSARLVQNNPPGVQWSSSPVTIVKSPTFSISPTSVAIPCGSETPVTFTMTHNMPGGGVTYNWSYSGWTQVSSTSNSKTLKPTSYPPSNVSVTPVYNGVNQPTKTATVTLAPFTGHSIQGNNVICSGTAVYTLSGGGGGGGGFTDLGGGNTVNWSISNPSVLSIVSQSNASVTLMYQSDGDAVLTATITNSCNQTIQRTKALRAGAPEPIGLDGPTSVAPSHVVWYHVVNASNNSSYQWTFPNDWQPGPCCGSSMWAKPLSVGANGYITVTATNDCGSETVSLYVVSEHGGSGDPKSGGNNNYKIFPNPVIDVLTISFTDRSNTIDDFNNSIATLYDLRGNALKNTTLSNYNTEIFVSDLDKGIYILKINSNGVIETHQIIVK